MNILYNCNRHFSIVLAIAMVFALMTIPVVAVDIEENDEITGDFSFPTQEQVNELTDSDREIIDEMTRTGIISYEQAYHILRVDKVIDKLEQNNQVVTSVDGEIVVLPAPDGNNYLTAAETTFIIEALSQEAKKINDDKNNILSYEEAMAALQVEMEENPGKALYSVDMGAGHTLTVSISETNDLAINSFTQKALAAGEYDILERCSNYNNVEYCSSLYSLNGYSEEEITSEKVIVTEDGRYSKSYELTQFSGVSYSSNSVSVTTEYSNNAYEASMDTLRSGQSAYGVITVANAAASIVVPSTSYYVNPTEWCEAVNQVVFTASSSITLGGIFSFSVNGSWTQYAIIRSSIVAMHAYAGVYY